MEDEIFVDANVDGKWVEVGIIKDSHLNSTEYDCSIDGSSGIKNALNHCNIEENTTLRLWKIIQQNGRAWKSHNEFPLWSLTMNGDVIFRDVKNQRKFYREYI